MQHYLDGELDRSTARKVASHLDDCRRCGLEAETYEELKRRLSRFSGQVEPEAVERLREFVDELTEGADA
ncbi:MAG: zf-HC2 domain-containing protein [Actinobacteria bacterium]|nr:zf-HC2 domain-containing protein [Actinomycetota bacterium]